MNKPSDSSTNYKEHHDPRNDDCPHNEDPERSCECKKPRNRKPYRRIAVCDRDVNHGVRPDLIVEIYPNARVVIREKGRRHRIETTVGTIYENCLKRDALIAIAKKRAARAERRKQKRAANKRR
jgi:hypothetical protein